MSVHCLITMPEQKPNPDYKLEIEGVSIVAVGEFNPAIFQPSWFSENKLIRIEEASAANLEIVHKNAAIFSTEWFSLQVTNPVFSLESTDPAKSRPLRDLALGTFTLLEHTPITAFGLNKHQHFRMSSVEDWHRFGHHFAPKASWTDILTNPGLRGMVMEGKREGCNATQIQVRIEPSLKVLPWGVYTAVNQHYNLADDKSLFEQKEVTSKDRMRFFLQTLQGSWDEFLQYSDRVSRHLFSAYTQEEKGHHRGKRNVHRPG